jgi:hypothetical protein
MCQRAREGVGQCWHDGHHSQEQLEHLLRAASQIVEEPDVVVLGSQAILASYPETFLPSEVVGSIEADFCFFDDVDEAKADRVDGAIGELSRFHESFGIYAQGVSIATAVLGPGWRDRVVPAEIRKSVMESVGAQVGAWDAARACIHRLQ